MWSNFNIQLIYDFCDVLNQHDDFLKTLLMGLSHCIVLCNGFFQEFPYFCEESVF